ncbi:methionyl-tRNA formyltransferase [Arcticibacter tournemirensis]|uniref:Methionyl-tRNA formyltransferase n=1 Tax=Arcticibacter tournemirensis TaxID=699437 RepID=A0A4Q0MAE9_9SPHI|nr:methionyl-tRNA formyltransferase [Arcticibacter tournemirensis]KAA8484410.1 methionyl-tRNA formyltransferase [Arcticibacter tournemirensis]RXF69779.1 methionyl-tRNA formyltransferase [Arcticibacter tournemirensis]TQM49852.1 methionyl-tRNA formyltransferase [Arcticibacter tournemirensis]
MRIIFMGTPEFAVASLDALLGAGFNVVAVVTAPDKPAGRGQKLSESAVKKYAAANNISVLQPEKLKDPGFIEQLRSFNADLQVVVAFRMLPEIVWNMPPKGTINLHASLLPDYRGAAPINWAVINGEKQTGVTTFFLQHEIDTGDILFSEAVDIGENETAGEVHDKLMHTGAGLLVKTVKAIEKGDYKETPQRELLKGSGTADVKHAPKIFKEDCLINWDQPAVKIYNHIRGLSPYPAAYTLLNDKTLKIYKSSLLAEKPGIVPGQHESDGKSFLRFACRDGFIDIKELQLEGKKKMTAEEFLRGYRLQD